MPKYKIGDKVWLSRPGQEQVKKLCPICFGKLLVRLILGDDSEVILPCDYCGKGYDGPQGYTMEYEYTDGAIPFVIQGMDIRIQNGEKEEVCYKYNWSGNGGNYAYEAEVYDTKEEAVARSKQIRAEEEEAQLTRSDYIKKQTSKTFTWNAGYHLSEAKRNEESAARHRKLAAICKSKAKGE